MIDEMFQDQAIALKRAGFGTSVASMEAERLIPAVPEGTTAVFRGWMMTVPEYTNLTSWLLGRGIQPFTSIEQYAATHYLPNWYPILSRWTPNTVVVPNGTDLVSFCRDLGWEKFQIKDYVKSLKTAGGSVATTPEEVPEIVANMQKYRGTIEGGICVRQWENFIPGSETRYFVVNGRYFGQDIAFDLRAMRILARIHEVVPSLFYSVDIAERTDGEFRIVEIGDGQVSDIVGWTPERFAQIWQQQ